MVEFLGTEDEPDRVKIVGDGKDEQDDSWWVFDVVFNKDEPNWAFSAVRVDTAERRVVAGAFLQPWDGETTQVCVLEPQVCPLTTADRALARRFHGGWV